jgi:bacterioferritin-associated ferredoxin
MFVCICNQVSDKQIRSAVDEGIVSNYKSLTSELNVGTCCGKCKSCAKKVLSEIIQEDSYTNSFRGGFVACPA